MAEDKTGGREYYLRIKRAFDGAPDRRIAAALGTTAAAVSLWRTNKTVPGGARLIRAAEVTGIRQEWFTTGEEQYLKHDDMLRPYAGPEHYRLAAAIDAEFKRVAKAEGISADELVVEVAALLTMPERNFYNYRTGKWSVPGAIIPALSARFKSVALLRELFGETVAAAMTPLLDGLEKQLKEPKEI